MGRKVKTLSGAMLEEHLWFDISSSILRYTNGQSLMRDGTELWCKGFELQLALAFHNWKST